MTRNEYYVQSTKYQSFKLITNRNKSMLGAEKRQCQTSNPHLQLTLRRAWPEVGRWSTYLAGSSSSWELRAGRTGPTVIDTDTDTDISLF